jgi:hypothetical protein
MEAGRDHCTAPASARAQKNYDSKLSLIWTKEHLRPTSSGFRGPGFPTLSQAFPAEIHLWRRRLKDEQIWVFPVVPQNRPKSEALKLSLLS